MAVFASSYTTVSDIPVAFLVTSNDSNFNRSHQISESDLAPILEMPFYNIQIVVLLQPICCFQPKATWSIIYACQLQDTPYFYWDLFIYSQDRDV